MKSIKNISLLRQQMEAQAAAQKLAAQHAANAALRSLSSATPNSTASAEPELEDGVAAVQPESPPSGVALSTSSDEPTDLTMDAEEKALRIRDRMEREQRFLHRSAAVSAAAAHAAAVSAAANAAALAAEERDREQHEPRPTFDFRHLIPQVSLKTGDNF